MENLLVYFFVILHVYILWSTWAPWLRASNPKLLVRDPMGSRWWISNASSSLTQHLRHVLFATHQLLGVTKSSSESGWREFPFTFSHMQRYGTCPPKTANNLRLCLVFPSWQRDDMAVPQGICHCAFQALLLKNNIFSLFSLFPFLNQSLW